MPLLGPAQPSLVTGRFRKEQLGQSALNWVYPAFDDLSEADVIVDAVLLRFNPLMTINNTEKFDQQDLLQITVGRMLELLAKEPEFDEKLLGELASLAAGGQFSHVTRIHRLLQETE